MQGKSLEERLGGVVKGALMEGGASCGRGGGLTPLPLPMLPWRETCGCVLSFEVEAIWEYLPMMELVA